MTPQDGLILRADEGERLVRRWGFLATVKVDSQNGASRDLVAITEVVPAGKLIPVHKHPDADEIVILLQGTGIATIGETRRTVEAGSMLFAPKGIWMGFENTGSEDAHVVGIFSKPGYEDYLRATSVPEGHPVTPLTAAELKAVRSKFADQIVFQDESR